jgi:hypothetical protein
MGRDKAIIGPALRALRNVHEITSRTVLNGL